MINEPSETTRILTISDPQISLLISGEGDGYFKWLKQEFNVQLSLRAERLLIKGSSENVEWLHERFMLLLQSVKRNNTLDFGEFRSIFRRDSQMNSLTILDDEVLLTKSGHSIRPRSENQGFYIRCIRKKSVTFGIGPAGTGKTYLAVAMAVAALFRKDVKKIILTRPAVEAGEKLGFLPGDLEAKINPYLIPLYDALYEFLGVDRANEMFEEKVIEIAPLAFMRGRTLNNAFVILDEAQNTTKSQMKMFLTRLGHHSKMVINGDITQTDLPSVRDSGLGEATRVLRDVSGIAQAKFDSTDVVRHPIVQDIINAYDSLDS